jgi:hypothetical protein
VNFAALPKTDSQAKTCVRWNPRAKRYELVVGGTVLASISRVGMSIRSEKAKFRAQVAVTAQVVRGIVHDAR